jgi:hypothetical protein
MAVAVPALVYRSATPAKLVVLNHHVSNPWHGFVALLWQVVGHSRLAAALCTTLNLVREYVLLLTVGSVGVV